MSDLLGSIGQFPAIPAPGAITRSDQDGARDTQASAQRAALNPTKQQVLSQQQVALLQELKTTDQKVRQHEMAHIAAGGVYVRGGATYGYQTGPDGQRYAVSGEVSIDASPETDPAKTLQKMRTVQRAALAPADPSAQDRAVAARASALATDAQAELIHMQYDNAKGSIVDTYV